MRLRVARDDRVDDGNANAAADVPEQVVEAAGVADLFVAERAHGDGRERDEDEARASAAQDDGPDERPLGDRKRKMRHPERGPRENYVARRDEPAVVELAGEDSDDGHHRDGADSARTDGDASGAGGVAENGLIEEREDGDEAVDDRAEKTDEDTAERKVAIFENFEANERFFGGEL